MLTSIRIKGNTGFIIVMYPQVEAFIILESCTSGHMTFPGMYTYKHCPLAVLMVLTLYLTISLRICPAPETTWNLLLLEANFLLLVPLMQDDHRVSSPTVHLPNRSCLTTFMSGSRSCSLPLQHSSQTWCHFAWRMC
jgi:hypothetical protein